MDVSRSLLSGALAWGLASTLAVVVGTEAPAVARAVPTCEGVAATVIGTSGDDNLVGTSGPDVIWAGPGFDTVHGRGGDDVICGGPRLDQLYGGAGADRVHAGPSADYVWGGAGDDELNGDLPDNPTGAGDTVIDFDFNSPVRPRGDETIDFVTGVLTGPEQGSDSLVSFEEAEIATDGLTTVQTAASTRFVRAGGRLVVTTDVGGAESVPLFMEGCASNDHFVIRRPNVFVDGGDEIDCGVGGYDRYDIETTTGSTTIVDRFGGGEVHGGSGVEHVLFSSLDARRRSNYVVDTGAGQDEVTILVRRGHKATIDTGTGNDTLRPQPIRGGGVLDVRLGPGSDDLTSPWANPNSLIRGGPGKDRIVGRGGRDVIDLGKGQWAPSSALIRGFEAAWGMGGDDDLIGGRAAESLVGGAGNDAISGNRGADRLFGNAGRDTLRGGPGRDLGNGGRARDTCATERRINCEVAPAPNRRSLV